MKKVIEKGAPIIIPNAENLPPEEVKRLKHNEKIRRYNARRKGEEAEIAKTKQEIRKMDTSEMVELAKQTRNRAVQLLDKKLAMLNEDDEELKKVNLTTLATTFGILFDKSQLAAGLATENIAIQAKIDINMSPDAAIRELNKMREKFSEENNT